MGFTCMAMMAGLCLGCSMDKNIAEQFINKYWPTAGYVRTRKIVDNGTLYEFSVFGGDRYSFDNAMGKDWIQADNEQDDWYYGEWINPFDLMMVNYLEGDIYCTTFSSQADFVAHVKRPDDNFKGLDAWDERRKERLIDMGLADFLH